MASSRNKRALLCMALAATAIVVACTEHGTLPTSPTGGSTSTGVDSLLPDGAVLAPAGAMEAGDVLRAAVGDDHAVMNAYIILLDNTGAVRWRSSVVGSGLKNDTLSFSTTGITVPAGISLGAVVAVRDSAGKFRYGGATTAAPLDSTTATRTNIVFAMGNYLVLPTGGVIGGMSYDSGLGVVTLSDAVANAVLGVYMDSGNFLPWSVTVGSTPGVILPTPGRSGHLLTINSTGTDVSSVDYTLTSAREAGRTALPAASLTSGTRNAIPGYSSTSGAAVCPAIGCANPLAIFIAPNGPDTLASARTVPMSYVPVPLDINALTPAYAPAKGDEDVQVMVAETDRSTAQTVISTRAGRSRCSSLMAPGTLVAAADNGGPVYLAAPGTPTSTTGVVSCPKVVRLDWNGSGGLTVDSVATEAAIVDPSLADGLVDLAVNTSGSRVAVATSKSGSSAVAITDGGLRRIGTIVTDNLRHVAFVYGSEASPLLAITRGDVIDIYETTHFLRVARYTLSKPVSNIVAVLRNGQMEIVAGTADGSGIITLRTEAPVVSGARLSGQRQSR